MTETPEVKIARVLEQHRKALEAFSGETAAVIRIADAIWTAVAAGNKVLICGNGGSASDSQHFAAELVGRFKKERRGLPAIALTTDSSILTCVSNDYGYDRVFERQVEALGRPGDVLVAISTSGSSANVLKAAEKAKASGMSVIGFFGKSGGTVLPSCSLAFLAPGAETARIQEMHILAIHLICELVEDAASA